MKKEILTQLIENTFAKLAAPAPGTGLYSELKNVINQAFELGRLPEYENDDSDSSNRLFGAHHPAEKTFHHTAISR